MADEWVFKSDTFDNCNCAVNCGCQFNLPSTHGYCRSAFVGYVIDGHFNGTPLAELNWAAIYEWPGEIKDGNGRRLIVIDERADAAQRHALGRILAGDACAPLSNMFAVFGSTISESLETRFLPVHLESNRAERTATVEIPGILSSRGYPIINEFNGEPYHIGITRPKGSFEFTHADLGLGRSVVTGPIEMTYEDSWAHWCVHHFDQDGLVRD